ncbi:S-layer homology domain-containing protein [Geosporobacter ferrireducens]|uniref:S-layer homology domain-containing protein n=1 Tax=Geosporobacter ferrireducens TaxID=1424294 RepID=UPI00235618D0|nr:S-layer homology domain-containing protein [Geosporobacter ferrireducens]
MFTAQGKEKRLTRILSLFIAVMIMLSGFLNPMTAQIVFANTDEKNQSMTTLTTGDISYEISGIALTPGKDATQLNIAWYTNMTATKSVVQVAQKSDAVGTAFPVHTAHTFIGNVAPASEGYFSNKVTVTGLKENTAYVYRLGDGSDENWSPIYDYATKATDAYSFLLVGDPQIGSSNVTSDTAGWVDTMSKALTAFPGISFMLSAGDQVNTSSSETEYTGYFAPDQLKSLPVVTTIGNHDNSIHYAYHFHVPNESSEYGITAAGGDYYFTHGDTLFMVLNTNNSSGATHKAFMQEAIEANPTAKWKIVMFHQSIYCSANHSVSSSITSLRQQLFPIFDEFEIDVVLMGHDHSYTRTYQMMGDIPQKDQQVNEYGDVINPTGTLYITANSGSGSKYYNLQAAPEEYAAVREQLRVPTFSHITVDENCFSISTYRTDNMALTDSYTILKIESESLEIIADTQEPLHVKKEGREAVSLTAHSDIAPAGFAGFQWRFIENNAGLRLSAETGASVTLEVIRGTSNDTKAGTAKVEVSSPYGGTAVYEVKVNDLNLIIEPAAYTMVKGDSKEYRVSSATDPQYMDAEDGLGSIQLTTADPSIAAVNGKIVTAKENGSTKITAELNGVKAETVVSVVYGAKPADGLEWIANIPEEIYVGEQLHLKDYLSITPNDATATVYEFVYGEANNDHVKIDLNGVLTALSPVSHMLVNARVKSDGAAEWVSTAEHQYLTIKEPVLKIETTIDSPPTLHLRKRSSISLQAKKGNEIVETPIVWTVVEGNGIRISTDGVVTADRNAADQYTIRAQANVGGITFEGFYYGKVYKDVVIEIQKNGKPVEKDYVDIMSLLPDPTQKPIVYTANIVTPVYFDQGDDQIQGWSSSNTKIAAVIPGATKDTVNVIGQSITQAYIIVKTIGGAEGKVELNITKKLDAIGFKEGLKTKVKVGETVRYREEDIIFNPATAVYVPGGIPPYPFPTGVEVAIQDPSIAVVNNDGYLTGVSVGNTKLIVTVITYDNQRVSNTLDITVYDNEQPEEPKDYNPTGIALNPGANATELNFAWYIEEGFTANAVQIAKKSDMTGTDFPDSKAVIFTGTISSAVTGHLTNKVTVTGLEESTEYVYRVGDGENWGPVYRYTTRKTDAYSFLLVGDPQIGSSNVANDTAGWVNTMSKAVSAFSDISFMMSAGDQVETATNETHYTGYFTPEELKSLPVATTAGNHDNAVNYKYHFNRPNESAQYGVTNAGGDYYFTHGNALYMILNSNNTSGATHKAFMEEAIAANPNVQWKIVMYHHSIYSSASHSTSSAITNLRAQLFPVFDELGIDVVLSGHDHSYTRSYQMKGDIPQKDQMIGEDGAVINPTGTLYITANSASGSKYYNLQSIPEAYAAVREQFRVPTFSHVSIDDQSFTITTYRVDTMEVTDTYTIRKTSEEIDQTIEEVILAADGTTMPAEPSVFYKDIKLSLTAKNKDGYTLDLSASDIVYKTDCEEIIEISQNGNILVKTKPEKSMTAKIWAEVTKEQRTITSNSVFVEIKLVTDEILFKRGSVWKYLDDGSDQGTAWRAVDFDDGSWKSGQAPLGYPLDETRPTFGSIKTLISYGNNANNKYATSYFRTEFTVEDLSAIGKSGLIEFGIDDSVILYLNGHEIGRYNLPAGEIPYNKYVNEYPGFSDTPENRYETFYLNEAALSHLVEGANVLAAEVHQDRPSSSDVYWDMEFIVPIEEEQEEVVVDKSALAEVIQIAQKLKAEDYTAESWKELERILLEVIALMDDDAATQEAVNVAVVKVQTAISSLIEAEEEDAIVPGAPANVRAVSNGRYSVTITWDQVEGAEGYNIYRSAAENGTYTLLHSLSENTTSYSNTGLSSGTRYYYKVSAVNAKGESPFSGIVSARTDSASSGGGSGNQNTGNQEPVKTPEPLEEKKEENKIDTKIDDGQKPAETPIQSVPIKQFQDLGNHDWAKSAIEQLAAKGIIKGTSEDSFEPGKNIIRADFIVLLIRALEIETPSAAHTNFRDVVSDAYYYEALGAAKEQGIVSGMGENLFYPKAEITRQDLMVMAARALEKSGKLQIADSTKELEGFKDASQVASYAQNAVAALIRAGIINGNGDGTLNPKGTATRAEAAVIICNILTKLN